MRISSIDCTRGCVMIIMALDHVRDLLHAPALVQQPTDLATTTPALFFTRWITHFCAPVFVFLAGASAHLALQQAAYQPSQRSFLRRRGGVLLLLEFTIINFGMFFDPGFHLIIFGVIATIGLGFIVLSFLSKGSWKTAGIAGLVIISCHNLLALFSADGNPLLGAVLGPLFGLAAFPVGGRTFLMAYPPIPWLGIMLVGYAAAHYFKENTGKRVKIFYRAAITAIVLFLLLRTINVYGDAVPWSQQKNGLYTVLSFLNVTKYPPSLLFVLVTLAGMFAFLALMERWQQKQGMAGCHLRHRIMEVLKVYGKAPLFYFIGHFYLIHVILLLILLLQGFSWEQLDFASGTFGRPRQLPSGVSLWVVYLVWILVVVALYQPCRWFGHYKARHNKGWLKYI